MIEELKRDLVDIRKMFPESQFVQIAQKVFKETIKVTIKTKIRDLFAFLRSLLSVTAKLTFYTLRTFKQYRLAAPKKWGYRCKKPSQEKAKTTSRVVECYDSAREK